MKKIVRSAIGAALGAALALSGVNAAAADEEPVLYLYNWADYISRSVLDDFEKETGIKVIWDYFDSYETLDGKLLTGGTGYDIVFPDNTLAYHHIKADIYHPLDMAVLSNHGNLDPAILKLYAEVDPGNQFVVPYMWWTNGLSFDAKKIKERMPDAPLDSLDLIFNPEVVAKFQDCGVMLLDSPSDVMGLALQYLGKDPNSNDDADLKAAADMLLQIRPYVRRFENSGLLNMMANGEACLSTNWSGSVVQSLAAIEQAGADIDLTYVVPKEGSNIGFDGMAIPKDAPHPGNAMKFLNFMLRPEMIARVTNEIGYASANAPSWELVDPELRALNALFPNDEARKRLYPTIPREAAGLRFMTREWTRVKTGG